MADTKKIQLKCPHCGNEFRCKAPSSAGRYSVACTNPSCQKKVTFRFQVPAEPADERPKTEPAFGLLEDGSFRFRCDNPECRQSVLVPAQHLKKGKNKVFCPKCKTSHEFEVEATEDDWLKCQTADCDGVLERPERGDGIFSAACDKCGQEYSFVVESGKVLKAIMKTPAPSSPAKQIQMKLTTGSLFGKKDYILTKGCHYIGRQDKEAASDFSIKDKYASSRSLRIDVNENGGNLIYKMTVEKASNPVYHNNRELAVGDIVYLTYGDNLKLGRTFVKIQKV